MKVSKAVFLILSSLILASATTHADDGSGTSKVVPTGLVSGSANNDMTFTYTATENLGDGKIQMAIPSGFPAPQSATPSAAGYTTVTVTDGVTAEPIDSLDSNLVQTEVFLAEDTIITPGWNSNDNIALVDLTSVENDTADFIEGTGSLQVNMTANIGLVTSLAWYNTGTPLDWQGYSHISFYTKANQTLALALDLGTAEFWMCSGPNMTGTCEQHQISESLVDIATIFSTGAWTQVVIPLDETTTNRAAILSYGFEFPAVSVQVLSTLNIDNLIAGPGDPILTANSVTVPLMYLNDDGTVAIHYDNVTAPSSTAVYTFTMGSSLDVAGTITELAESPEVSVVDLNDQPTHCEDVDSDGDDECAVDTDDPADGCDNVFVDPDTSSCVVAVTDANAATDGNTQDCSDFFVDVDCNNDNDGCPDYFWDSKNDILTVVTPTKLDVDGNGTEEDVCSFDSNGDGTDDSFMLVGTNGSGSGNVGGSGSGNPNPFSVSGSGGCSLMR